MDNLPKATAKGGPQTTLERPHTHLPEFPDGNVFVQVTGNFTKGRTFGLLEMLGIGPSHTSRKKRIKLPIR